MKKLKEFLQKYLRKIILGIIITLAVLHFIVNFEIVQNTKLMEQSWINLINGYILTITMSIGLIFLIWITFLIYKETAKDLEKFLLNHLTTACFLSIMILGFHGILGNIEKNFTLTTIGAIIVFWYGYKTYERDKENELITNYSDKYNHANEKSKMGEYNEIIDLWYQEYFLYKKGYISEELWREWDYWIEQDIGYFLGKDCDDSFVENTEEGWSVGKFLSNSLTYSHKRSDSLGYEYGRYIVKKIESFLKNQSDDYINSISFYTDDHKKQLKKHYTRIRKFYSIHIKNN